MISVLLVLGGLLFSVVAICLSGWSVWLAKNRPVPRGNHAGDLEYVEWLIFLGVTIAGAVSGLTAASLLFYILFGG